MAPTYGHGRRSKRLTSKGARNLVSSQSLLSPTKHDVGVGLKRSVERLATLDKVVPSFTTSVCISHTTTIRSSCTSTPSSRISTQSSSTAISTSPDLRSLFDSLDIPCSSTDDHQHPTNRKATFFRTLKVENDYVEKYSDEMNDEYDSSDDTAKLGLSASLPSCRLDSTIRRLGEKTNWQSESPRKVRDLDGIPQDTSLVSGKSLFGSSSRTYGSTRSFRVEEKHLSDDEEDVQVLMNEEAEESPRQSKAIRSTLDLRVSGMNNQYREEIDIFVEDYQSERHLHNRRDLLIEFEGRIESDDGFRQYFSTTGFPLRFLKSILKKDSGDMKSCLTLIKVYSSASPNCHAVSVFCQALSEQPQMLDTMLRSREGSIAAIDFLASLSEDVDIGSILNASILKSLIETVSDNLISARGDFLESCIRICEKTIQSNRKGALYAVSRSVLNILDDFKSIDNEVVTSILRLGILLTSIVGGLPKNVSTEVYKEEVFLTLLDISRSDDDQMALFSLGFMVSFADESGFLEHVSPKCLKVLKERLEQLELEDTGSQRINKIHSIGYFCVVYGKLAERFQEELWIDRGSMEKVIEGLRRFGESIGETESMRDEVTRLRASLRAVERV